MPEPGRGYPKFSANVTGIVNLPNVFRRAWRREKTVFAVPYCFGIFDPMLEARNIYKKYGAVEVLKGVGIDIQQGEIVSIVGPSGSGKSTLLHILGTLDEADSGDVHISGVHIESRPPIDVRPAPWWKRLVHLLVDALAYGLLSSALYYAYAGEVVSTNNLFTLPALLISFGVFLAYYTLLEGLYGRTLGKLLTGSRVMELADYSKPRLLTALFRTLARLIPFEACSFLSARPVGWHDALGNAFVTDSRLPWQKRRSLSADALSRFRNEKIGFVFQFHHLLPEFTALENVCIAGWINNKNKAEVRKRAEHLLRVLGLEHRIDNKPAQLSGGEAQRVAVARALINQPLVVFADEPTGNLDTQNARELHQLFFDLRKEFSQTFLIVTHNEELARLSDRMLTMKDGKIVSG